MKNIKDGDPVCKPPCPEDCADCNEDGTCPDDDGTDQTDHTVTYIIVAVVAVVVVGGGVGAGIVIKKKNAAGL